MKRSSKLPTYSCCRHQACYFQAFSKSHCYFQNCCKMQCHYCCFQACCIVDVLVLLLQALSLLQIPFLRLLVLPSSLFQLIYSSTTLKYDGSLDVVIMYKSYDHAFEALCIITFWCSNFGDLVYMNCVFYCNIFVLHFAYGVHYKYFGVALYYCTIILVFIISIMMHSTLCFWISRNYI